MLTKTELLSRFAAPNLAEPLLATASKPRLAEITVFTDNQSDAAGILEFAGLLAEENGARLIDVFIRPAPPVTPPQEFARGAAIREVIESHESQLESIEARQRARFDNVVRRHGIQRPEWRSLSQWSSVIFS
jgi:hypothetical protein